MKTYTDISSADYFSHIYIEKEAYEYPVTSRILDRFRNSVRIEINHYKDVFNRGHQDYAVQKSVPSLILAVKHGELIYPGAKVCQSFNNHYFYYTSNIMNCIYDCEYCYLQGMYPSGNIVVFVNLEDIFADVEKLLAVHPVYLCISYDTDMLAMEAVTGFVSRWCEFGALHPCLTIEIRTKSAYSGGFGHFPVSSNIIFAWTLSPDAIISSYEHRTPSLDARLQCLKKASDLGYTVRLCFDPMIYVKEYRKIYSEFYRKVFEVIPADAVLDISLGLFRISASYIKAMQNRRINSITAYPYTNTDGVCSYDENSSREMLDFARAELSQYISQDKIFCI